MKTKKLVLTAIIAGIYFALCRILPFGYGPIQLRIAEIMTLLPLIFGWTGVFGVTIGCAIANMFSPFWIIDVIFGSTITLVAAILTYFLRKKPFIAAIPPVLLNALFLPVIWWFAAGDYAYLLNFASTFCSQFIVIFLIGLPLSYSLKKSGIKNLISGFLNDEKKSKRFNNISDNTSDNMLSDNMLSDKDLVSMDNFPEITTIDKKTDIKTNNIDNKIDIESNNIDNKIEK